MAKKKFSTEEFCRDLARISAKQLRRLPQRDRESGMAILMENTSLYSPYTYKYLKEALGDDPSDTLKRMRKALGGEW